MNPIIEAREALSVSQAKLAEMIGVHQSTISRMEADPTKVDQRTLLAIKAIMPKKRA
jgi:DNA-binding XRE family transcriptional regulator